ncbi:hypothetical protein BH23CHL4_BH23CHL4_17250 [soil metagenome]
MFRNAFVLGAFASMLTGGAAYAQPATPVTGECAVAPRSSEEVRLLSERAATPTVDVATGTVRLPAGDPVDAETIDLLLATLDEADACAQARDLLRFLALYTDSFIVESILAPEPAGVIPGNQPPGQENQAGTPTVAPTNVIDDARLLEDGRIAAHVFTTGASDFGTIVWFELVDDRWRIDDIRQSADPPSGTTTVPAGAEAVVDAAVADAAFELGVSPDEISLVSIKSVDWPDTALGCPEEGGVYAQVITPGYRILLTDSSETRTYHTDAAGTVVNCTSD